VVIVLHRPFLPGKLMLGAIAAATFTLCLAFLQSRIGGRSTDEQPRTV